VILVDSSVWIDYFRGLPTREAGILDELLGSELLATGDLVLAEVLQGFRRDREFEQARELLSALGIATRKTIDTVIATRCIVSGYALLYSDRDFDPFVKHLGLRAALAGA